MVLYDVDFHNETSAKVGITQSQADAIVANTAKVGITTAQANAITANTAKVGITTAQANAITANTTKTNTLSATISDTAMNTMITTAGDASGDNDVKASFTIMGILVIFGQIQWDDDSPIKVRFGAGTVDIFNSTPVVITTRVGDGGDDVGNEFHPQYITKQEFGLNRSSGYDDATVVNWIALGKKK